MTATKQDYDVGTAAALSLIQQEVHDIMPQIPFPFKGRVPVDKEPAAAAAVAKVVIDAVEADHAKRQPPRAVAPPVPKSA